MIVTKNNSSFDSTVRLSSSKSESNRALMIRAYGKFEQHIRNLSEADDTVMLRRNLKMIHTCADSSIPLVVDCGNAGTVFRFLVTYLANYPGRWMLTGTQRMKERPIGDLVEALRALGANITYKGENGFPPLLIEGKSLAGGKTSISMDKSSQFASSVLLLAPMLPLGLKLTLTGNMRSVPYLDMTLEMMRLFGAEANRQDRLVVVEPKPYQAVDFEVQADWSAASYWFEMVAFSEDGRLLLKDLHTGSLQGDEKMVEVFEKLGVGVRQEKAGLRLFRTKTQPNQTLRFNFADMPDLLPAVAACCAGLGQEAHFTGVANLAIKETDRTAAMQKELARIGVGFMRVDDDHYHLLPASELPNGEKSKILFETYGDHRMAMALAPLAMKIGRAEINNPEVVSKSYPSFWDELQKSTILLVR
jgi:3-phosphoshikimate 1-carboxyvinyltransferase